MQNKRLLSKLREHELFASVELPVLQAALQDEAHVKALRSCLDVNAITLVFWQAFVDYFTAKTSLERQKAQLKCDLINRYFGAFIPMNPNPARITMTETAMKIPFLLRKSIVFLSLPFP